jgi:hypothetical protein
MLVSCQACGGSARPRGDEPARPPDPLDLIGHNEALVDVGPLERAKGAVQTLTRLTREKAAAVIGHGLQSGLTNRGDLGDRAWRAISEMPEPDQRAALDSVVDDLEKEGFGLYRLDGNDRG